MKIRNHQELDVYKLAFEMAMNIFKLIKTFPKEERYSLTDQIRRSSRSVAANLAEAFRKRKYPKHFISKLSDCEAEAAETQTWLEFSWKCEYIKEEVYNRLNEEYNKVLGKLVKMSQHPEKWVY